jgi:hypothetical protein
MCFPCESGCMSRVHEQGQDHEGEETFVEKLLIDGHTKEVLCVVPWSGWRVVQLWG